MRNIQISQINPNLAHARGGEVVLYKRPDSQRWQARFKLKDLKWRRVAKGKFSVEIASDKELVPTLELLKGAALSGELDAAIDAASDKLRAGFKK